MRLPVRPIQGAWPSVIERVGARYFRRDVRILLSDAIAPEAFREAMSAFVVGNTFKITGSDRHAVADSLLLENVDLTDAVIVDVGASDGSTALDLLRKLPAFRRYVVADLALHMSAVRLGRHVVFYDQNDRCNLIAGPRMMAWPTLSRGVRLIYSPLIWHASRARQRRRPILMLNPEFRDVMASDKRVDYQVHDVFTPWAGPTPDVIKVANLLRRLYFDDETLRRGIRAILTSLAEGGHFLLVENPRAKVGPRAGLYRKVDEVFVLVAETADSPEIADLVPSVRVNVEQEPSSSHN